MTKMLTLSAVVVLSAAGAANAQAPQSPPIAVTVENFARAESDLYFSGIVRNGGFGKLDHTREPAPLDKQTIIRLNRDNALLVRGFRSGCRASHGYDSRCRQALHLDAGLR
jgi:hypothetical protein